MSLIFGVEGGTEVARAIFGARLGVWLGTLGPRFRLTGFEPSGILEK